VEYPPPPRVPNPGEFTLKQDSFETDFATYKADYGTISVQENRNNPDSRMLQLHFVRIRSPKPSSNPPVFYTGGQPGQSNLDFKPFPEFLNDRDFVMVGYRGVDNMNALLCFNITQVMAGQLGDEAAETRRNVSNAFSACAEDLQEAGYDLSGYNMQEMVQDIEAVRTALKYEKISFLGASFGARIATSYNVTYKQRVDKNVLVAPILPGKSVVRAAAIKNTLTAYADIHQKQNRTTISPLAAIETVLPRMQKRWLLFPIDPGKVRIASYYMLQHNQSAAMIFDTFSAAAQGDASGLVALSMSYDPLIPSSANWAVFAALMTSSDFDSSAQYGHMQDGTIFGSPREELVLGSLQKSSWPIFRLPERFRRLHSVTAPTLVLSGSKDFLAIPDSVDITLMPHLEQGTHIRLAEAGHAADILGLDPVATSALINTYLNTGQVQKKLNYLPFRFDVALGFPKAAKIVVGIFLFILLLLSGLFFLLYRQLHLGKQASPTVMQKR